MTVSFDTLTYSKNLTKAGEKPEIAEVHALALKELADSGHSGDDLVTKEYLEEKFVTKEFLQAELHKELEPVKTDMVVLKTDMAVLKAEMTLIKWMIGGIGFGVFLLVVKTFLV